MVVDGTVVVVVVVGGPVVVVVVVLLWRRRREWSARPVGAQRSKGLLHQSMAPASPSGDDSRQAVASATMRRWTL